MAEHLRRLERAFFERLTLVRSGGDSIRRIMGGILLLCRRVSCLDKEKRRLESNRRESSAFLRTESRLPRGGFFRFCRRADHRGYKNRADNL